jgi:hypothetical protein
MVPICDGFKLGPECLVIRKWCLAIHHLVKNTAKGPNIRWASTLDNIPA